MQPTLDSTVPAADAAAYLDFARALAAEAAEVAVVQFRNTQARRKADGSLVTFTDEAIDKMIADRIRAAYPGHAVLSEEQNTVYDPTAAFNWVVDPVDGTTNFARGLLVWGVSIGLLHRGRPVMGVVAFPLLNEEYYAAVGQGAFRSGERIRTAAATEVDDQQLMVACTRTLRSQSIALPLKLRLLGSAAYHQCKVAEGTALAGTEATPKIWDLAAVAVLLAEAGGVMVDKRGRRVFPVAEERIDYRRLSIPVVYAANEAILAQTMAGMGLA